MKGSPELGGPFVSSHLTLVHNRFLAERGPHPPQCAHWGTFPPGEGSGNAVQFCKVVPPKKAFPWGKVAAKRTDEGCVAGSSPPCTNVPTHPTEAPIQSIWRSQTPFVHILNKFSTFFARSRKSGWTFFARLRTMGLAQQRGRTHDP